jgi:hypothetical protein
MGAVGLFTVYKMDFAGSPTGFEELHKRGSPALALLIVSVQLAIPLSLLGVAGLLTYFLEKLGQIKIKTKSREYYIKGLLNVPDIDMCDKMWRYFEVISTDPETRGYFIEQAKLTDEIIQRYKSPDNLKKFVLFAATAMKVLTWTNKEAQAKFRPIFAEKGTTINENEKVAENAVDQAWIENTMDNYEKLPPTFWSLIEPLGGEWILSIGPGHKSPRYMITSRRVFFFGKTLEQRQITEINVPEIVAVEVAI